ncbi:hypothetical protein MBAV_003330 [Candidatus Magnetobacterium bavaricum]|uniref:Uncharacterized protein n=1 Tax=Candidatus Magnetobacterium bavaricum TaxID=29290 RepID=A0A0F3GRS9_9BACT|nr:hypothetical protein MBAV_003330 [Candidatus Magnetobacterium bavaricum]
MKRPNSACSEVRSIHRPRRQIPQSVARRHSGQPSGRRLPATVEARAPASQGTTTSPQPDTAYDVSCKTPQPLLRQCRPTAAGY